MRELFGISRFRAGSLQIAYKDYLKQRSKSRSEADIDIWANKPIHQAAQLVHSRKVDAGLAGCVLSTAEVLRAIITHIGCRKPSRSLSGAFVLHHPSKHETLIFSDCAVIIEPNEDQLADVARLSKSLWKQLIVKAEPRVAFVSFSTHGSAKHPSQEKMRRAFLKFQQLEPTVVADGELQFDAAYVQSVAKRKCPQSPVAGKANCFIFPNLDAANPLIKSPRD